MKSDIARPLYAFLNEDAGGITINNKAGTPVVGMGATNEDDGVIAAYNRYGKGIGSPNLEP